MSKTYTTVALLAEGVDRNFQRQHSTNTLFHVALLAEGVDRNPKSEKFAMAADMSPSSRRAWIEMACWFRCTPALRVALLAEGVDRNNDELIDDKHHTVALLAEGVDRNVLGYKGYLQLALSPSSRRAWIEIRGCTF